MPGQADKRPLVFLPSLKEHCYSLQVMNVAEQDEEDVTIWTTYHNVLKTVTFGMKTVKYDTCVSFFLVRIYFR